MPRKTAQRSNVAGRPWPSFNEAAARCRGKLIGSISAAGGAAASMRPRPDAAENFW